MNDVKYYINLPYSIFIHVRMEIMGKGRKIFM